MADEKQAEERDRGLARHDPPDPAKWDEQKAVTGRPSDTPSRGVDKPAVPNSTLGERAKARTATGAKAVDGDDAEDKALRSSRAAKK